MALRLGDAFDFETWTFKLDYCIPKNLWVIVLDMEILYCGGYKDLKYLIRYVIEDFVKQVALHPLG